MIWIAHCWISGMDLVPMTGAHAAEVVTWRYAAPYDCYDMTDADPAFLASPYSQFYALVDDEGLLGFRSFGEDGQVPGGTYDSSALDTGGGLRPDLVGRGFGYTAMGERLGNKVLRRLQIADGGHHRPETVVARVLVEAGEVRPIRPHVLTTRERPAPLTSPRVGSSLCAHDVQFCSDWHSLDTVDAWKICWCGRPSSWPG